MPIGKYTRVPRGACNPRPAIRVIGPSIAYIPLTKDQFALIDAEDADVLEKCNWFAHWYPRCQRFYAQRRCNVDGKSKLLGMHQDLLRVDSPFVVDHANTNSLDNRKCNLRSATQGQNKVNCGVRSDSKTGTKGVTTQANGKFTAYIGPGGKVKSLGTFLTLEEAKTAYALRANEIYGAFARLE